VQQQPLPFLISYFDSDGLDHSREAEEESGLSSVLNKDMLTERQCQADLGCLDLGCQRSQATCRHDGQSPKLDSAKGVPILLVDVLPDHTIE
jgi:hypothetical protein